MLQDLCKEFAARALFPIYLGPEIPEVEAPAIWVKAKYETSIGDLGPDLCRILFEHDYDHLSFQRLLQSIPHFEPLELTALEIDRAWRSDIMAFSATDRPTHRRNFVYRNRVLLTTQGTLAQVAKFAAYIQALDQWVRNDDVQPLSKVAYQQALSDLRYYLHTVYCSNLVDAGWRTLEMQWKSNVPSFEMFLFFSDSLAGPQLSSTVYPIFGSSSIVVYDEGLPMLKLMALLWPTHMREVTPDLVYEWGSLTFVARTAVRVGTEED